MGENVTLARQAAAAAATTGSLIASVAGATSSLALAGPIGAAIAGITAVTALIIDQFRGCGDTCVLASNYADEAERALVLNRDSFVNLPAEMRYESLQAAAANNAKSYLSLLYQACSNPQLGDAGRRCISERLIEGGSAPWCPKPGGVGCDWLTLYYKPILESPTVPDPSFQATAGGRSGPMVAGGAAAGGGGIVASGGDSGPGNGYLWVMALAFGGLVAWRWGR